MTILKSISVIFTLIGILGLSIKQYIGFHDSSVKSSQNAIPTSTPLAASRPEQLNKISESSSWIGELDQKLFKKRAVVVASTIDASFDALTADSTTPEPSSPITELRTAFWRCFPSQGMESKTQTTGDRFFHVGRKGCQIAERPSREPIEAPSTRLNEALRANDLDLSKLKAVYQGDQRVMTLADNVVFVVTPELSKTLGSNGDLATIAWVNYLRVAVGQPEIELAKAQLDLYGLEETPELITGVASWYGPYFHGRLTATGEVYNQFDLTAASRTLPFDTYVKVTNKINGKRVVVRINDRGPYVDEHLRVLDLSYGAATYLGSDDSGIVPIDAVILKPAPGSNLRMGQKIAQTSL